MTASAVSNVSFSHRLAGISKARLWSGRALSTLAILFMAVDGGMKLFKPPFVVEATLQMGYPESAIVGIGVALLISTLLYAMPRTAIFGAILLTGYLGGAVASCVRMGAPVFSVVFPGVFAVIVWASLAMRDPRLENVLFHHKGENR
jgi:hypothetical protein